MWYQAPPLRKERQDFASCALGDRLYVFGGSLDNRVTFMNDESTRPSWKSIEWLNARNVIYRVREVSDIIYQAYCQREGI